MNMQVEPSTASGHILFVDDDVDVLKAAGLLLARNGLRMTAARGPAEAWSIIASEPVDVILLDLNFTRGATTGADRKNRPANNLLLKSESFATFLKLLVEAMSVAGNDDGAKAG